MANGKAHSGKDVAAGRLVGLTLALTLICLLLPMSLASAQWVPQTERRIALVIGNATYENVESLANPANDSAAMRESLAQVGFELYGGDNLTLREFNNEIEKFDAAADLADVALVYYSGHGFQYRGRNYLVPRDAQLKDMASIEGETVRLDSIISKLQDRDRQTLVFLDACRNNPLPPAQRQENGLAQVQTNGDGVYVAFATEPGDISYDGRSDLSPFTRAMTQQIAVPEQSLADLMIEVRREVRKRTLEQQIPWEQSSLSKQFYFNPGSNESPKRRASLDQSDLGSDVATKQRSTEIGAALRDNLAKTQSDIIILPDSNGGELSNVIVLPEAPIGVFGNEELVMNVQTELQRVGCYKGQIDGVWGKGASDALGRYYKVKKVSLSDPDPQPDETHLGVIRNDKTKVCKDPVVRKPPPVRTAQNGGGRREPGRVARGGSGSSRQAPVARGPAPKTISRVNTLGAFR